MSGFEEAVVAEGGSMQCCWWLFAGKGMTGGSQNAGAPAYLLVGATVATVVLQRHQASKLQQKPFLFAMSANTCNLLSMRTLLWWGQAAQAVAVAEVEAALRVANTVSH